MTLDEARALQPGAKVYLTQRVGFPHHPWSPTIELVTWLGLGAPPCLGLGQVRERGRLTHSYALDEIHLTEDAARARVKACARKRLGQLRRLVANLAKLDVAAIKVRRR